MKNNQKAAELHRRRIIIFDLDYSLKNLFLFLKQPDNIVV